MRRVGQVVGLVVLALLAGAVVLIGVVTGPYIRDDLVLDRVVRTVALDWRDFGEEKARSRLQYELDHRSIGMQVGDDDCALESTPAGERAVRCDWGVTLEVPATGLVFPLAFSSHVVIAEDGSLR